MALALDVGLCEDDDELRGVVKLALEREGCSVRATASGAEALRVFAAQPPAVLILDIGLPDADGRDVCQALRSRGARFGVLFLTARSGLSDRLSGFHAGGDDYLPKPFALEELLVRITALAKRSAAESRDDAVLTLDPVSHALLYDGTRIPVTPTEFRLLAVLTAHPGEVVRRSALISAGWPAGAIVHDNTLDAYIAKLRRKLRESAAPVRITTTRGVGYILQ